MVGGGILEQARKIFLIFSPMVFLSVERSKFVPEPLVDAGPVFLLDMRVILFGVGAAAGELDGIFSLGEVAVEVAV